MSQFTDMQPDDLIGFALSQDGEIYDMELTDEATGKTLGRYRSRWGEPIETFVRRVQGEIANMEVAA